MHRKRIYLISPPEISDIDNFISILDSMLSLYGEYIFAVQLRIKSAPYKFLFDISIKIYTVCKQYNVFFIINDNLKLAHDLRLLRKCDGLHIGIEDQNLIECRKILPTDMIIGISCYDKMDVALKGVKEGANYVSFGAFFPSKTKPDAIGIPKMNILYEWQNYNSIPSVSIGGITAENCSEFLSIPSNIIALCNYIWCHEHGPINALGQLVEKVKKQIHHLDCDEA